jgi:hypothetical protein
MTLDIGYPLIPMTLVMPHFSYISFIYDKDVYPWMNYIIYDTKVDNFYVD